MAHQTASARIQRLRNKDKGEVGTMSTVIIDHVKRILFRVRWYILSDRARYVYLWNRTKDGYGPYQ